jgi:hypothetical protein
MAVLDRESGTASTVVGRMFSGHPKIVACGLADAEAEALGDARVDVMVVERDASGGLVARGVRQAERDAGAPVAAPVAAPFAGITVVACAGPAATCPVTEEFVALWTQSGLTAPEVLAEADGTAATRARVAHAMLSAALAEHRDISAEAVSLDRQIAVLREQVEDARNKWQDALGALQAATRGLPVLAYHSQTVADWQTLAGGAVFRQRLPFPSAHCRAFGFRIDPARALGGDLQCRLEAVEEGTALARWDGVAPDADGWVALTVPKDIPWRYRNLAFSLRWSGPEAAAPKLALANAAGLERFLLHRDGEPLRARRAAMRVWAGLEQTLAPAEAATPDALAPSEDNEYGFFLTGDRLRAHTELVKRELRGHATVRVEGSRILVHPTPAPGPTAVSIPVEGPYPAAGIQLMAESPKQEAPRIDVMVACYPADLGLTLDPDSPDPLPRDGALATSGWMPVQGGSSVPIMLELGGSRAFQMVLATRVPGGNSAFANLWFADVKVVCRL